MAKPIPKPPKAIKAKVTVTQKNGTVTVLRFNSREQEAAVDIFSEVFDGLKAGSKIFIEPSHVEDLPVAADAYLEYLFSYNSGVPGDFIEYRTIAATTEAEARDKAFCDELWTLLATSAPSDLDFKTFTGTTPIV